MDPVPSAPLEEPIVAPPIPEAATVPKPKSNILILIVVGTVVLGIGIMMGFFLNKKLFPTPRLTPIPTPLPTETSAREYTPKPTLSLDVSSPTPARNIVYKYIPGWTSFKSATRYEFQHPSYFEDFDKSGELLTTQRGCELFLTNNVGGVLVTRVVPYDGGSRRKLYGTPAGYTYRYEEAIIQGRKSLVIETGPLGDSGGGSGVVIPDGTYALIVSWDHQGKDSIEFNNLLQSIKIEEAVDITKCGE